MAGLNRGIPRYADGTDDVAPKSVKTVPVDPYGPRSVTTVPVAVPPDQRVPEVSSFSKAPVLPADSFTPPPAVVAPPVVTPPPAPPPVPTGSGFGQLMSGVGQAIWNQLPGTTASPVTGFAAARDNPGSSPATAALGQFGDYLNRLIRVEEAQKGPSRGEALLNLFTGSQSDTTMNDRIAAAKRLRDPLVSQHIMTHEGDLREAETNPVAYAAKTQDPTFIQSMKDAAAHYNGLTVNGAVHNDGNGPPIVIPPDQIKDAAAAAKIKATVPGSTDAHAVAATQPQDFSADQFARIFQGMPKRDFATIFGPVLAHVSSPQEQIQRAYFGGLQTEYLKRVAEREKLLSANPNADVRTQDAAIAEQLALIRKEAKAFGEITTRRPSFPTE